MSSLNYLLKEDFIWIKDSNKVYCWRQLNCHYVFGFTLILKL